MASSITSTTLGVTVTESLTLNGVNHGSTKRMNITGINEVSKRIMTVLTTGTQIFKGHESVASYGQFIYGNVKYIRITNLDNDNPVTIHIEDATTTAYTQFLIPAGHVFFLTDAAGSYGDNTSVATPSGNIERIDALASTAAVDIEILVASA